MSLPEELPYFRRLKIFILTLIITSTLSAYLSCPVLASTKNLRHNNCKIEN